MKNLIKRTFSIYCLLFFSIHLQAQPNQATIFVLENHNIAATAASVSNHLINNSLGPISLPSINDLIDFFSVPFGSRFYTYAPQIAPTPGIRVFDDGTDLSFRFDNIASSTGNLIFMGAMEYIDPMPQVSFSVHGPEVFNGVDYTSGEIQYRIFMVATYSSLTPTGLISPSFGRVEVVIVDKNIL